MKPSSLLRLSVLSAGLALCLAPARADDTAPPAAPAPSSPDAGPANGGRGMHRGRMGAFVLGELTAKLGLTAEQVKAVGAIIADGASQAKVVHGDETLSQEDRRAKMKGIFQSTRTQIRAALTPSQQKEFDALPANNRGRPAPPPPPAT